MTLLTAVVALIWGIVAGYLIIRFADSLIALGVCAHGLYRSRWQRLSDKAHTTRINPGIILRLMVRISLFALAFAFLLRLGHYFSVQKLGFEYQGLGVLLWGAAALGTAASRLSSVRQRIIYVRRMSHEYDYAEKRRRTQMLRS
ncbi:hypothetical protein [Geoalkalibacter halelectricus]|uniref:Uncharacterized protein n=1 Tax=Geoalkalibacter halelectricus TaxID=2847045 RepID=A0ABY5ZHZ6_9BACT|nr:hypothetical protein [Geoalkalibacter halelectricus]MDO3379359.1 hypothetical protein [Geoalkalibacter halelectricus]UWZ78763.1 hypothetical protein L9S41_13895 [Geoalkalibacter halelectricus]